MRIMFVLFCLSSAILALEPGIGFSSGVIGPVNPVDNQHYDPSIYIEPNLHLALSGGIQLEAACGFVFANGGEFVKNYGQFGDIYGNYQSDTYYIDAGFLKDLGYINAGLGLGYWSFHSTRDVVGNWDAD
jgi:hypothetical protein